MVTNYIKRNRSRIPNGPGWIEAWAKIRLEAHIKYNLSRARTPTGRQAIREEEKRIKQAQKLKAQAKVKREAYRKWLEA